MDTKTKRREAKLLEVARSNPAFLDYEEMKFLITALIYRMDKCSESLKEVKQTYWYNIREVMVKWFAVIFAYSVAVIISAFIVFNLIFPGPEPSNEIDTKHPHTCILEYGQSICNHPEIKQHFEKEVSKCK